MQRITELWRTLISAWAERSKLGDNKVTHTEREFLPAALGIQETPPSPTGRVLTWSLMLLFSIAVTWACFGEVDIVSVAEGKIIPSGQVKQIQPLEKGVVKIIYVTEGQMVKKGEPLIELDQTITFADQKRLGQELTYTEGVIQRQTLFVSLLKTPDQPINFNDIDERASGGSHLDNEQIQLLWQEWQSFKAGRAALLAEKSERAAEKRASIQRIKQLEQTLPFVTKRAEAVKGLHKKHMAAETVWMELEERRIEQVQSLAVEQATQDQLASAIQRVSEQLSALEAQVASETLSSISEYHRQQQNLIQELDKAKDLNRRQILHAPISGKVQQLAIHTIGGVVTPAQPLMLLVPTDVELEVEAWLENKDIGFVEVGQSAEIKVNTFPFTKYGIIEGMVVDVTQDAVVDEQEQFRYRMRVGMAKSTIQVANKRVDLIPGMAVSAEVKTGKRRLIEYVMAPLIRYKQESVRER
jgi:membrane fusion protein, hemolysin D